MMDSISPKHADFRRGEGYLVFMGYLQIVTGALTLLFSLMVMAHAWAVSDTVLMSPARIFHAFGSADADLFTKMVAAYMSFQVMFGWILGLGTILAGIWSLNCRARRWVTAMAVLNLINFPHGTTVAIMVLHGMTRPGIAGAFR
ncbi:hypothetical protein [Luteolibacter marinus]|uniref:hypothetical protein n=1 Tax=Luteolibacter marinus TaxID=2776705 RepID=UPI00186621D0|nr:hypothetical protein [Luteolibacter marinus]